MALLSIFFVILNYHVFLFSITSGIENEMGYSLVCSLEKDTKSSVLLKNIFHFCMKIFSYLFMVWSLYGNTAACLLLRTSSYSSTFIFRFNPRKPSVSLFSTGFSSSSSLLVISSSLGRNIDLIRQIQFWYIVKSLILPYSPTDLFHLLINVTISRQGTEDKGIYYSPVTHFLTQLNSVAVLLTDNNNKRGAKKCIVCYKLEKKEYQCEC